MIEFGTWNSHDRNGNGSHGNRLYLREECTNPVSYTHLDVYKRQDWWQDKKNPDRHGIRIPVLDENGVQKAVSYTHLNAENARALADPETGLGATIGKIMTTVARMCAGDKVPYTDEKKVMEYDSDMYARAKQAQMIMASMKKKQKE